MTAAHPHPAAASLASLGPCRRRTVRRLPGGQRRHRTHQQHLATPHGLADPHALRQLGRARQAPDRPGRPPAHLCRRPGTGAAAPVPPRCAGRSPRPARTGTSRDQILPGVTWCEAWPALRAHLLLIAADGHDPITELATAAAGTELGTATDPAAVLDWRLDPTGTRSHNAGPLPWIPSIPHTLAAQPEWGPYLTARGQLVADLADTVHQNALIADGRPGWLTAGVARPTGQTIADITVWRAANNVPDADQRPTGERQLPKAAARWQHHLEHLLAGDQYPRSEEHTSELQSR